MSCCWRAKRAFGRQPLRHPSRAIAANSVASSSIGERPAASASSSHTLMPSSNTASSSSRASASRRRGSDGPPQSRRRPPHDSMSLSAKPCSANAWSIKTCVEWGGSSRTETRSGYRVALMSASERIHRSRVDHEHETVPARIDSDDAHGKWRAEQADPAIGLREQRRRIDQSQLDAVAVRNLLGENGGTPGESPPRAEGGGRAAADPNHQVAHADGRRCGVASGVENDLPESLGAYEICTFRQWFHCVHLRAVKVDVRRSDRDASRRDYFGELPDLVCILVYSGLNLMVVFGLG